MGTSSKAIRLSLEAIASQQEGFFTAKQAVGAGYNDSVHPYHLRNGDWVRVYRGIYRLASFPLPPWPELTIYSLWSRDRGHQFQGTYAGETALMIHGILEIKPGKLHMIVPIGFRKNCEIPEILELIKQDLTPEMVEERDGYRVVTVEKALADLSESTNPEITDLINTHKRNGVLRIRPSFDDMLNMGID